MPPWAGHRDVLDGLPDQSADELVLDGVEEAWSGVGTVVPPRTRAVLSGGGSKDSRSCCRARDCLGWCVPPTPSGRLRHYQGLDADRHRRPRGDCLADSPSDIPAVPRVSFPAAPVDAWTSLTSVQQGSPSSVHAGQPHFVIRIASSMSALNTVLNPRCRHKWAGTDSSDAGTRTQHRPRIARFQAPPNGSVVCATLRPSTPSYGYSLRCGGGSASRVGGRKPAGRRTA